MKPTALTLSSIALLTLGSALAGGDMAQALGPPAIGVDRLAQSVVTITGLTIVETETGVQLTIETDGAAVAVPDVSRTLGNALILEIPNRSEEHTSELQSPDHLVCRLLLEKKKNKQTHKSVRF